MNNNTQNVVAIGIGGSYLGPLFVHTALQNASDVVPGEVEDVATGAGVSPAAAATGRTLRFVANVDPVDAAQALQVTHSPFSPSPLSSCARL